MSIVRALVTLTLGFTVVAPTLAADRDFPVDPGSLSMHQSAKGTMISFRARKGSVSVPGGESPFRSGAQLQVFNSAGGTDDLCAQLPASGWRATGPVSWAYSDPGNVNGPVRRAHFGQVGNTNLGDITVSVKRGVYTLDEPSQRSVSVTLRMGNLLPLPNPDHTRYCTDFKPPSATVGRDAPGIFRARFNPPNQYLGPCPAAPSVCSPSGAFLDDSSAF